ncbi:hypothetical protein HDU91_000615 [Kappamyces sp. JEL0680]|nr:hypothetical protein HDU91_000615 [Kappamyces sp. JEL0680]
MTVVVDTTKEGLIVSSCTSIPQVWVYGLHDNRCSQDLLLEEGSSESGEASRIPFVVTRPEAIGTLPEYRGRGLIEKHMNVHHQWAADLGAPVQFIGGIPGYYTRFGYHQALFRGQTRYGFEAQVENHKLKDAKEEFVIRLADADSPRDISFLTRVGRLGSLKRSGLWNDVCGKGWRNYISGRQPCSFGNMSVWLIEKPQEGSQSMLIGFVQMASYMPSCVVRYELDDPKRIDGISWQHVTPAVIRWLPRFHTDYFVPKNKEFNDENHEKSLQAAATTEAKPDQPAPKEAPKEQENDPPVKSLPKDWQFIFSLGRDHPAYNFASLPSSRTPTYWYIRIPDFTDFIKRMIPVLNHRLSLDPTFCSVTRTINIATTLRNPKTITTIKIEKGLVVDVCKPDPSLSWGAALGRENKLALMPPGVLTSILMGQKAASHISNDSALIEGCSDVANYLDVLFPPIAGNDAIVGMD